MEKKYESTLILVDELETKNADVEKERELLELNLKTIELEKSELLEQFEKLQSESESLKCDLDEFKIITKSLEEEKASISESNATISQTKDEFETKYQSVLVIVEDLEGKKQEIEKESEALKENIKEIQHEKEGLLLLFIKTYFLYAFFLTKKNKFKEIIIRLDELQQKHDVLTQQCEEVEKAKHQQEEEFKVKHEEELVKNEEIKSDLQKTIEKVINLFLFGLKIQFYFLSFLTHRFNLKRMN